MNAAGRASLRRFAICDRRSGVSHSKGRRDRLFSVVLYYSYASFTIIADSGLQREAGTRGRAVSVPARGGRCSSRPAGSATRWRPALAVRCCALCSGGPVGAAALSRCVPPRARTAHTPRSARARDDRSRTGHALRPTAARTRENSRPRRIFSPPTSMRQATALSEFSLVCVLVRTFHVRRRGRRHCPISARPLCR